MTEHKTDLTQLIAERFGEDVVPTGLPQRTVGRAREIAAMHSPAHWYAEQPELPTPRSLTLCAYVDTRDELERLARLYDAHIYGGTTPQFDVDLGPGDAQLSSCLMVAVRRPDGPL